MNWFGNTILIPLHCQGLGRVNPIKNEMKDMLCNHILSLSQPGGWIVARCAYFTGMQIRMKLHFANLTGGWLSCTSGLSSQGRAESHVWIEGCCRSWPSLTWQLPVDANWHLCPLKLLVEPHGAQQFTWLWYLTKLSYLQPCELRFWDIKSFKTKYKWKIESFIIIRSSWMFEIQANKVS